MNHSPRLSRAIARSRRGFTIIELLVVIGIISVLAAIVLVAGGKVLAGGKQNATRDVIRILDTSLESFTAGKGGLPEPIWKINLTGTVVDLATQRVVPVADARDGGNLPGPTGGDTTVGMINSSGLYIAQAITDASAKSHLDAIPPKFIQQRSVIGSTAPATKLISTPIDAWGRPIRFVMPVFDGVIGARPLTEVGAALAMDQPTFPVKKPADQWAMATIRRNNFRPNELPPFIVSADSDGGKCIGKRPYFYSTGEDLNPATTTDNVYSTQPTFLLN